MTYSWTLINHALNLGIRCGLVVEILWPTIGNLSHHVIYLHNNLYTNIPWLIFHDIFIYFLFRRYPVYDYETGLRLIYAKLPLDLICQQCIIQFTYVAGKLNLDISSLAKLLLIVLQFLDVLKADMMIILFLWREQLGQMCWWVWSSWMRAPGNIPWLCWHWNSFTSFTLLSTKRLNRWYSKVCRVNLVLHLAEHSNINFIHVS